MESQATTTSFNNDYFVLHTQEHYKLSQEEIDKAVSRHEREHPSGQKMKRLDTPQKTTPQR